MGPRRVVGIVAGGGSLPREIAEHVNAGGGAVHIVAIIGEGDRDLSDFPLTRVGWAQTTSGTSRLNSRATIIFCALPPDSASPELSMMGGRTS